MKSPFTGWTALAVAAAALSLASVFWAMAWCNVQVNDPPVCPEGEHAEYSAPFGEWRCVENETDD